MNKSSNSSIGEYVVTSFVTIIVLFSICLFVEMQLYFNIESIINKRELAMKNLSKFYDIEQLEEMRKADPNNYLILISLAKAYEKVEQYKTSDKLYKDALGLSKYSDYALYSYAIFCAKMGWYPIACDIAEEFDYSKKKTAYKYRAEIYYELAKNFDKNNEFEASVKAYQVTYKYAKNVRNSKFLNKVSTDYAKEFIRLADYNIKQGNIKEAILNLKNSLSIKELNVTKYKLALIYKDIDKIASEKYFHEVFKSNPYLINPQIYSKLLVDLVNESKNNPKTNNADLYSVRLTSLKNKMQEYYVYKGDILFTKSNIGVVKKFLKKEKKYILYANIKNNTAININNLFIKTEIVANSKEYKLEKKIVNSSTPLEPYNEIKDVQFELPDDFSLINADKNHKQNDVTVKYFVKKQKKAPWTLAKIELINF